MTITEVSTALGLSPDTLRYYERIGLIPPIKRNESGRRDYSEGDCEWIQFVRCMRTAGLSIESLMEYVSLLRQGEGTAPARKEVLLRQREGLEQRIEELGQMLQYLNRKIDLYEEQILPREEELRKKQGNHVGTDEIVKGK